MGSRMLGSWAAEGKERVGSARLLCSRMEKGFEQSRDGARIFSKMA